MNLPLLNTEGTVVDTIEVTDNLFAAAVNQAVVHQVMVAQMANARQGTAKVKTRTEVAGGGRKPRPQKYTGRSRQGSIRAPHWKGGGIVFGPRPRSYRQEIPKRLRRLAIRSVLTDKAQSEEMIVLQDLAFADPKTKNMVRLLENLKIDGGQSTLLVTRESEGNVIKSARNLPRVKTLPVPVLNVLDILKHRKLVMTVDAVRKAEELWGTPFVRAKVLA